MADTPVARRAPQTIWSIQYLRAISALGVVLFHSLDNTPYAWEFGAIGIHIFFGISGFLIYHIAGTQAISPGKFLSQRIRRIAPPYWIATVGVLVAMRIVPGFFWQASADPVHVLKSLFFIPQTGVDGGIYPILYQGWTLDYEMFFYATFALCLFLPIGRRLWALTAVIVLLSCIGLADAPAANPLIATYTAPICLAFVGGAWVAKLYERAALPGFATSATLFAAGWACLWLSWRSEAASVWLPPFAIAASVAAILFGAVALERGGHVPKWRAPRLLGEASYSIYLFQTYGFATVARLTLHLGTGLRVAAYATAATLWGLAMYAFVEMPLQRWLRPASRAVA